jgi:hypothetical protein
MRWPRGQERLDDAPLLLNCILTSEPPGVAVQGSLKKTFIWFLDMA